MGVIILVLIVVVLILYNSPDITTAYNFLHSNNPVLLTIASLILIFMIGLAIRLNNRS